MKQNLVVMGILSWLLGACNSSVPTETDYFGYDLPIDSTPIVWTNNKPQKAVPQAGNVRFFERDNFFNQDLLTADGIGAIDTTTNQLLWQTAYPEKIMVSRYNKNDSSYISAEGIMVKENRLFCLYKHTIPPQQGDNSTLNETFYKYLVLDANTGEILKKDAMKLPIKDIEFVFMGNNVFIKNQVVNQINRLNPTTGDTLWTYPQVFQSFGSLTDQTISFFNDNLDDTWQITVLDLATGKPIFEKKIEDFAKHRITNVLCQNNTVLVAMGAAYEINPLGAIGVKYKEYTVAFDLKSAKPIWRTDFVKN